MMGLNSLVQPPKHEDGGAEGHVLFRYPLMIREQHLDTFGHVNNAAYFQILEEARWEFITSRGFGMDVIRAGGIGPTILGFNDVRFIKELRLRQHVIIESQMISYEKKIGLLRQDIVDNAGVKYFTSTITLGLFDTTARKLILPTQDWLHAVGFHSPAL